MAQRIVNDTDLPINAADFRPINATHLRIGISTSLSLPLGLSIKLDACDLWLYNPTSPSSPYARIPILDQHISSSSGGSLTIDGIIAEVTDPAQIDTWLTSALTQRNTSISVRASTTAWLGAVKLPLTIDKTVTIPGLRNLAGATLAESRLYIPALMPNRTNIAGTMVLPNYSLMTMDMGNVTLNALLSADDSQEGEKEVLIGRVDIRDALLHPGNQSLPFTGEIYLDAILRDLGYIASGQAESVFKGGFITLTASGNQTLVEGQHIGYLEAVLARARIRVEVPLSRLLSDVVGSFDAGTLSLDGVFGEVWDGLVGDGGSGSGGGSGGNSTMLGEILENLTQGEDGTPGGLLNDIIGNWDEKFGKAVQLARRERRAGKLAGV